ncbi:MAG: ketopantoate reductase family protein [Candidatus Woesearchaeota archaeon]
MLNEVCQAIKPKTNDDTIILSLLNGFAIADKIRQRINKWHVLLGLIYISVKIDEPGVIKQVSDSLNIIFGKDNAESDYYLKKFISLFDQAGINYKWSNEPVLEI